MAKSAKRKAHDARKREREFQEVLERDGWKPMPVTRFDYIADLLKRMIPEMEAIPEEFFYGGQGNPYVQRTIEWFYQGTDKSRFRAKEGIDAGTAFGHLGALLASFDLKHEHKIAGVAYLMSQWFDLV